MQASEVLSPAAAERVPRAAACLGAAGLIPFAVGSVALWMAPIEHVALTARLLIGYAAITLSFMGAVHWGLAMAASADPTRWFTFSVSPALLGWCALMLSPPTAIALLSFGFVVIYLVDCAAIAAGRAPQWYRRLRTPLSWAVLVLLLIACVAASTRLP